MYERINERVGVIAVFAATDPLIRPYFIKWRNRWITVKKIGYLYQFKEGDTIFYVVSVTDNSKFYELHFNTHRLTWEIGRMTK